MAFLFDFRSIYVVETGERDEDALMEVALEAGADDVEVDGDVATFYAAAGEFLPVKEALPMVVDIVTRYGLKERIKIIASGKLITPAEVAWAYCAGVISLPEAMLLMRSFSP